MSDKKRVLVIDGNNNYLRAFTVNPSIATNGSPIGGIVGFMKTLQKLCREVKPNKIVVCWDGAGGSSRRKSLFKGYKDGRKPLRLNRNINNLDEDENMKNRVWQMTRLIEYLNCMPVIQLMMDSVEADDLISHITKHPSLKDYNKVIVSNDKDFIQLCDDSTILYRPTQKEILNKKKVVEQYGIHPNNFCLARSLSGDNSDNLDGVDGIGLPTVSKRFPLLAEEKDYTISDIVEYCKNIDSKVKAYGNVLEQIEKVKRNYSMMQLAIPNVSVQDVQKITYILENSECTFQKTDIIKMSLEDGFGETNWEELFICLRNIVLENCKGE